MSKFALLVLISITLFCFGISANYEAARKQAQKEHKVLMVLLAKKSDNLQKILQEMMHDKETRELIDRHGIFVLVYKDNKQSYPIEMLYSDTTPALFFLDADELFICETLRGRLELEKIRHCLSK